MSHPLIEKINSKVGYDITDTWRSKQDEHLRIKRAAIVLLKEDFDLPYKAIAPLFKCKNTTSILQQYHKAAKDNSIRELAKKLINDKAA